MTAVERDLYHLGLRLDAHLGASERTHESIMKLVSALDDRTDKLTMRLSVLFGGIAVGWALVQIFTPLIQSWLRIPA